MVLLLVDLGRYSARYRFLPPRPLGDDPIAVADTVNRNRVLSYYVGMAARESAGNRRLRAVFVPEDLGHLSNAEPDDFGGRPNAALSRRLVTPLVRGRLRALDYDLVLPAGVLERFESENRVVEFPRGVYAVRARDGGADRVQVFTDAARSKIIVVPVESLVEVSQ